MGNSILAEMIETGAVSEGDLLFSLHKTGKVDVVKWIKETVSNIKLEVSEMTNAEAILKLRETASYLEAMACIIEDIDIDTAVDCDHEEEQSPNTVTVVGSNQ